MYNYYIYIYIYSIVITIVIYVYTVKYIYNIYIVVFVYIYMVILSQIVLPNPQIDTSIYILRHPTQTIPSAPLSIVKHLEKVGFVPENVTVTSVRIFQI